MEYRDQLKYIKSHSRKRVKITALDKLLWKILIATSGILFFVMAYTGIFPMKYMAIAIVTFTFFILFVKFKQKRACHSGKKHSKGKGLALIMSVVYLISSFYLLRANQALNKIVIGDEVGGYEEEHEIDVTMQPFNIYISGIDVYGGIEKESRSDVNLIATIHPQTHKILLTTTPRDYYVTIPGVSGEQRDKLTHAGIYGIDASMATLENLYQTEIPFYVRVNFTSVIEIVDAMGGVDVDSDLAFTTGKASGAVVEIHEGKNHLNGKEALAFVRERKAFIDGDNQRGKNQQALLTALIEEIISPMIVVEANEIINCVSDDTETNMSESQIKSLLRMQLDNMQGWEIESVAATGDSSGKQYCYSYSEKPLYVTVPDMTVVEEIGSKIRTYLDE